MRTFVVMNMVLRFVLVTIGLVTTVSSELVQLTCEQKEKLVDGHNVRRLLLAQGKVDGQPGALRMNYMIWDEDLASKAESWAAKYQFSHNPDRTDPSNRFDTGENIYWHATTKLTYDLDVNMALTAWWDEYKDFTYKALDRASFSQAKKIGHYTQMAWADTTYLGCAVSVEIKQNWKNNYVVCNYGPAGNYIGDFPYKKGQASILTCDIADCSKPYGDSCSNQGTNE